MLISNSLLPRSIFNMDLWTKRENLDPFDYFEKMISRNLNWFDKQLPEKFRVTLDCSGFKSESIKTDIKNNLLIVTGNEEERKLNDNNDYSVKQFKKTYKLPSNAEKSKLVSFMTSNGRFVIEVPLKSNQKNKLNDLFPKISQDKKSFNMNILLPKFTDPTKINVICKDRHLVVKYEDNTEKDNNFSKVKFVKSVLLPENTQFNSLNYEYENNVLSITALLDSKESKENNSTLPTKIKNQIQN
jgi:HSP20 family molecular chaperone IbpA